MFFTQINNKNNEWINEWMNKNTNFVKLTLLWSIWRILMMYIIKEN